MSIRKYANFADIWKLFHKAIMPNITNHHLDFGCGEGISTFIEAIKCPSSTFIGYDSSQEKTQRAKELLQISNLTNLQFTEQLEYLRKQQFGSAGANFVFHEDPTIFTQIHPLLATGDRVSILDYNLKGTPKRQFIKTFCLDNEKGAINREGINICHAKHTATDLTDCIKAAQQSGFTVESTYTIGNYFTLIGRKE